jgi:hypothetical protein
MLLFVVLAVVLIADDIEKDRMLTFMQPNKTIWELISSPSKVQSLRSEELTSDLFMHWKTVSYFV